MNRIFTVTICSVSAHRSLIDLSNSLLFVTHGATSFWALYARWMPQFFFLKKHSKRRFSSSKLPLHKQDSHELTSPREKFKLLPPSFVLTYCGRNLSMRSIESAMFRFSVIFPLLNVLLSKRQWRKYML